MKEIWKPVNGYEGIYEVSNLGRVKRLERQYTHAKIGERILKQELVRSGYLRVMLHKNGIGKRFLVHRLVADAFIENVNNYQYVNHIDANKRNNSISNLEWCTQKQNMQHAMKLGLLKTNSVFQNHNKHFIVYKGKSQTMTEWEKETGISVGTIWNRIEVLKWDVEKALTTIPKIGRNQYDKI